MPLGITGEGIAQIFLKISFLKTTNSCDFETAYFIQIVSHKKGGYFWFSIKTMFFCENC